MCAWKMICRLELRSALLTVGVFLLLLPISCLSQNTVTQTLNATIVPLGGLFMQSAPLALTKTNTFQ